MSAKDVLSEYLAYLDAVTQDHRDLVPIGEQNYFTGTFICGASSVTQPGAAREPDHVPSMSVPLVKENTFLVLPEAYWAPINKAFAGVEPGVDQQVYANSAFGTSDVCGGTVAQQAMFLAWYIPQIKSTAWLWALGGLAAAAFAGGIIYTLGKRS